MLEKKERRQVPVVILKLAIENSIGMPDKMSSSFNKKKSVLNGSHYSFHLKTEPAKFN